MRKEGFLAHFYSLATQAQETADLLLASSSGAYIVVVVVVVMMMTFSSRARIVGDCSTIHSLPAFVVVVVVVCLFVCLFFNWRLACAN